MGAFIAHSEKPHLIPQFPSLVDSSSLLSWHSVCVWSGEKVTYRKNPLVPILVLSILESKTMFFKIIQLRW